MARGFKLYEPLNPLIPNPATDTWIDDITGADDVDLTYPETSLTTLQGGTKEYRYLVPFDDENIGTPSADDVIFVVNILPPSSITATAIEKDEIQIAFTDAQFQNGYVYRINGGDTTPLPDDKIIRTGLTAGTSYTIEIATKNATNDLSAWANTTPSSVTTWATITTPPVPTASNVAYNSITWTTADNQDGITSYFFEDNYGHSQEVTSGKSWTINGLRYNTDYQARVRAYRSTSNEFSNWSAFSTPATKTSANPAVAPKSPAIPTLTGASQANGRGITWTFNATSVSGESVTYKIWDSNNVSVGQTTSSATSGNLTISETTNVNPNTSYSRYITASNTNGESQVSSTISVLTVPDKTTLLTSVSGQTVNYSWDAKAGSGYKLYEVGNATPIYTGTNTTFSQTSTEYRKQVYVCVYNASGNSEQSNIRDIVTTPNAPTGLTLTKLGNGYRLNWSDGSSIEDGFKIQKRINGGTWTDLPTQVANTITYTDTFTIVPATLYEYQVCAYTISGGNSSWIVAGAETIDAPAISGTVTDAQNKFRWDWVSVAGAEGYVVHWTNELTNATGTATIATNYWEHTWASGEEYYSVYVVAYSTSSYGTVNSGNSNTAYLYSSPRVKPTNLTVTKNGTKLQLSWTDNSQVEKNYLVERKLNNGDWVQLPLLGQDINYFEETVSFAVDTIYQYRVTAKNTQGDSLPSDIKGYVDSINPVALDSTLDDANDSIEFTWTQNSIATGYKLYTTENGTTTSHDFDASTFSYTDTFTGELIETAYVVAINDTYNEVISVNSNEKSIISSPRNTVNNLNWTRSDKDITFTWDENSTVEDGFKVKYQIGSNPEVIDTTTDATYTVTIPDYKDELKFSVAHTNAIGDSEFVEEIIIPSPAIFQGAYNSSTHLIKLGWVDNSTYETSYIIKYLIDGVAQSNISVPSTSSGTVDNIYLNNDIDLTSGDVATIVLYAIKDGKEQFPSDTLTIDKVFYQPEPAPDDLRINWPGEGIVNFTWTGNTIEADGYRLTYTVYHEDNSHEAPVTTEYSATIGTTGEEYSTSNIPLTEGDSIFAQVQAFTLVDDGELSDIASTTYYYIETPVPPTGLRKERTDLGTKVMWDSVGYVDVYEVDYAINGVWQPKVSTTSTELEILIDYSSTTSVEIKVSTRYLGGKISAPSTSISFVPVRQNQPFYGEVKNIGVVTTNLMNGFIYTKTKIINAMDRVIIQKGLFKRYILSTISLKRSLTKEYYVRTLNYYHTSFSTIPIARIIKKISDKYYINTKSYKSYKTPYTINTKICKFNYKYDFGANLKPIIWNKTKTVHKFQPIIGNFGLQRKYTDFMTVYGKVATQFPLQGVIKYKISVSYLITSDIHKIFISSIGDSIFAGHPGWWAEAGNGTLTSGSGNVESQFQYWLDKRLDDNYEIFNKGKGSNTTTHIRNRFVADIVNARPQYVIINGGTNDIAIVTANRAKNGWTDIYYQDQMNITLQTMKDNMIWMVDTCLANDIKPILTTLIPRSTAQPYLPERNALWDYNAWIISYANSRKNEGVYYVDFYNAGKDVIPPTPLEDPRKVGYMNPLYDGNTRFDEYGNIISSGQGVHPNVAGFKIMAESIPLSIFEVKASTIKVYLDPECTEEEILSEDDIYNQIYEMTLTNMNRGRTKLTTRYIKNIGLQNILYALYPTSETGADIKFSLNGEDYTDTISTSIAPGEVQKIDITLAVPRIGDLPDVALQLPIRTYKKIII